MSIYARPFLFSSVIRDLVPGFDSLGTMTKGRVILCVGVGEKFTCKYPFVIPNYCHHIPTHEQNHGRIGDGTKH